MSSEYHRRHLPARGRAGGRAGKTGGRQAVTLECKILRRDLEEWKAKPEEGTQFHFTCHFEFQKGDDDTVYLAASLVLHQDQLSRERSDLRLSRLHSACWLQGLT